jgi:hypothetical protein
MSDIHTWLGYRARSTRGPFASSPEGLLQDAADCCFGYGPSCPSERLGDLLLSTETEQRHRVDEMPNHIGISAYRRRRFHKRADGLSLLLSNALPSGDRIARYAEPARYFLLRETQKLSKPEDTKPLRWGVVRTPPIGDLIPSLA